MAKHFRIEHVAPVPTGYRVRTIVRRGHRVRVAFPPGRREKGSGKLIEVLHPVIENPCRLQNPAELVIMAANPHGASAEHAAADLSDRFHGGAQPDVITDYQEPEPYPATLSELGDLLELRFERCNGWKWGSLDMTGRGVKLSSNPQGTQIYFIGGNQKLSKGDFTCAGADRSKELIDLGAARYIAYRAKKAQVNGISSGYEHYLGEETEVYPRLMYDRRGPEPRLLLVGGAYRVEGAGIVN